MKVVIGLGNPGEEYKGTRHNLGYLVVDKIAEIQNSKFKIQKKLRAEIGVIRGIGETKKQIILVKPLTFMNQSGEVVKRVVDYFLTSDVLRESLFVIHDELDLPLGKLQIRKNISAAGHHGVESVIYYLKTQDFVRFRVGVGIKSTLPNRRFHGSVALSKFAKDEIKVIKPAIKKTAEAVVFAIENGVEKAMEKYNQKEKKS